MAGWPKKVKPHIGRINHLSEMGLVSSSFIGWVSHLTCSLNKNQPSVFWIAELFFSRQLVKDVWPLDLFHHKKKHVHTLVYTPALKHIIDI